MLTGKTLFENILINFIYVLLVGLQCTVISWVVKDEQR